MLKAKFFLGIIITISTVASAIAYKSRSTGFAAFVKTGNGTSCSSITSDSYFSVTGNTFFPTYSYSTYLITWTITCPFRANLIMVE